MRSLVRLKLEDIAELIADVNVRREDSSLFKVARVLTLGAERISDILRHYIEHRFDLRAPERTTEEFLIELQYTDALSESDKGDLGEFLTHCDMVKFAKYSPTTEQIQQTFDLVKSFIEKTKSDETRVDVTDALEARQTVEVRGV